MQSLRGVVCYAYKMDTELRKEPANILRQYYKNTAEAFMHET